MQSRSGLAVRGLCSKGDAMIPELGHFALVLALGLALIQATVPVFGARRDDSLL